MTRRQRLSLALLMPVTLALVGVLGVGLAQPVPEIRVNTTSSQFNDDQFEVDFTVWVDSIAETASKTDSLRSAIADHFVGTSLPVETRIFSTTLASSTQPPTGQVWVTSPGAVSQAILVSASYAESPGLTLAGRLRGVATVVELAKVFAQQPHHYTFVFMVSDSRLGVEPVTAVDPGQLVAVVDLTRSHFLDTEQDLLDGRGLYSGYSPLWLQEAGRIAILSTGRSVAGRSGLMEFFDRALPFHIGKAAAYLGLGTPALRLTVFNGLALERLLSTLDALDPLPSESVQTAYWRLSETHYLPNWATPLLQILLFAPLFVFTVIIYRQGRPREEELRPEFTAFLAWVVVGLDGYAIAFSLVAARLLPQYELFPAAPGDPFLLQPTWWAALALYGTIAAMVGYTFWGWRGSGGWGRFADRLNIPHRQTTLLILLSGFACVTWFVNGFTAVVVFGLPAYLWPWIEPRRTLPGKIINTALALTGLLPLLVGLILAFGDPAFGPWWWFFPMGAAYGFFPLLSVLGFIGFSALFFRFLRHGWR